MEQIDFNKYKWEPIANCPICGSAYVRWHLSATKQCSDCGSVFRAEELVAVPMNETEILKKICENFQQKQEKNLSLYLAGEIEYDTCKQYIESIAGITVDRLTCSLQRIKENKKNETIQ